MAEGLKIGDGPHSFFSSAEDISKEKVSKRDPHRRSDMSERKTIVLPKSEPLGKRVSSAGKQIREWLSSLERPSGQSTYALRLKRWDQNGGKYRYHYELLQREEPQEPAPS
jgi:hypothetical protein